MPAPTAPGVKKREALPRKKKGKRVGGANPKSGKVPLKAKKPVPKSAEPGATQKRSAGGASSSATAQNGYWPYSYNSNPNVQVGRLFYDTTPGSGTNWNWCTATAISSENKSVVLTAGHCVFNPDPDKNGVVNGNGYWYEQEQFCPGYENTCNLGIWYARNVYSTNSWVYGTNGNYAWQDDIATILVSPNSRGYLVNVVGGQGIAFNLGTSQYRRSFGYPGNDSRWPQYSYDSGADMAYCYGYDSWDGYGHLKLPCTMTGGASGGPWIINPNSAWLGTVNGVNSHKPTEWDPAGKGGAYMGSPYFDTPESNLYQYVRNR